MAYGGSQAKGPIGVTAAGLTTAIATSDLSHVFDLHHSSWKCWILNPLIEARYQTHSLMVPSWICCHCAMTGMPNLFFFFFQYSQFTVLFQFLLYSIVILYVHILFLILSSIMFYPKRLDIVSCTVQ